MDPRPAKLSLICYADGASRGNPGPAAIGGIVLRAGSTAALEKISEAIGIATNNVAEWRAAIAVLAAAQRLGARSIELRMDSELVVRQLQGRYQVRHPGLRPLYEQARALLAGFDQVTITHVPRARNARADKLANEALDRARQPGRFTTEAQRHREI
jgi:probable phosphoglycerate mutase